MEAPNPSEEVTEEIPKLESALSEQILRRASGKPEPKIHLVLVLYDLPFGERLSVTSKFPTKGYRFLFKEDQKTERSVDSYLKRVKDKVEKDGINGRVIMLSNRLDKPAKDLKGVLDDDGLFRGFDDICILNIQSLRRRMFTDKISPNEVVVSSNPEAYFQVMGTEESEVEKEEIKKPKTWSKGYGLLIIIAVVFIILLWMFGSAWGWVIVIVFLLLVAGIYYSMNYCDWNKKEE